MSINEFLDLNRKKETLLPQCNLQNRILCRETSQSLNSKQDFSKYLPADSHLPPLLLLRVRYQALPYSTLATTRRDLSQLAA